MACRRMNWRWRPWLAGLIESSDFEAWRRDTTRGRPSPVRSVSLCHNDEGRGDAGEERDEPITLES